jgi:hypothetical protein
LVTTMMKFHIGALIGAGLLLAGCSKEPPPPSVSDFVDNPILLEAAVVRCGENRHETRYEAECVNARQAVSIIAERQDREKAEAFEVQSERKRQALRRTQEAAAQARRRSEEYERHRKEAEYLAQFGELPPDSQGEAKPAPGAANAPGAVLDAPAPEQAAQPEVGTPPASDEAPAPVVAEDHPMDIDQIREELNKRDTQAGD